MAPLAHPFISVRITKFPLKLWGGRGLVGGGMRSGGEWDVPPPLSCECVCGVCAFPVSCAGSLASPSHPCSSEMRPPSFPSRLHSPSTGPRP